jgi:transposase
MRIRRSQKVDGVKPHVLLDSSGVLVAVVLTPADVQDRPAFPKLLGKAKPIAPSISHVWVDKGYTGQTVAGGRSQGRCHRGRGVRAETRPRVHRPTVTTGWLNTPTAGSSTAAASTATTKPP